MTTLGLISDSNLGKLSDANRLLPVKLAAVLTTVPRYERGHLVVAVNACSTDTKNCFRADLRIYMEACLYSMKATRPARPASFLITEDYIFFRTYHSIQQLFKKQSQVLIWKSKFQGVKSLCTLMYVHKSLSPSRWLLLVA